MASIWSNSELAKSLMRLIKPNVRCYQKLRCRYLIGTWSIPGRNA
jgi:hypothetical protein